MRMKKKKEIEFNPADYDYMDKMPLEGWLWEVVRRNSKYKDFYNRVKNERINATEHFIKALINETKVLPTLIHSRGKRPQKKYLYNHFIFSRWRTTHYDYDDEEESVTYTELRMGIPDPDVKYTDFTAGYTPIIYGLSPIVWYLNDPRKEYLDILPTNDMLQIIIPITTTTTYIGKILLPIIKSFLKTRKTRIRTDKWKYYLIAYELEEKRKMTYEEIANVMAAAYPEMERLFDAINIENYYKNALELISGGYKEFITPK